MKESQRQEAKGSAENLLRPLEARLNRVNFRIRGQCEGEGGGWRGEERGGLIGIKKKWTFINIPRGIVERTSHCEDSSKKNNATR